LVYVFYKKRLSVMHYPGLIKPPEARHERVKADPVDAYLSFHDLNRLPT